MRLPSIRAITLEIRLEGRCFFVIEFRRISRHGRCGPAKYDTQFPAIHRWFGKAKPGSSYLALPDHVLTGCQALGFCFQRSLSSWHNHKYRLHVVAVKSFSQDNVCPDIQTTTNRAAPVNQTAILGLVENVCTGTTRKTVKGNKTANKSFPEVPPRWTGKHQQTT